ncbi:MAG: copper resistance protein B [Rhodanobacter sp.]
MSLALWLAWAGIAPGIAIAQQTTIAPSGTSVMEMGVMQGMDQNSMPRMRMPADASNNSAPSPATKSKKESTKKSSDGKSGVSPQAMPEMSSAAMMGTPSGDISPMAHGSAPPPNQNGMESMPDMRVGPMQGGSAPPNARSPDYSQGVGYGSMKGMDMADNAVQSMVLIDQLEAVHGRDANGQDWEVEGWYGNDSNKLWIRTEGERSAGKFENGDLEALWNHSLAPYWSTQLGARQDVGVGPGRTWAAFGVQGVSPYWFELEATAYAGSSGRTAARVRAEYELLLAQKLILQPELEANLYGKDDLQRRIGTGLSDVQLGLRLRYEMRREFAPYIGVNFVNRMGTTADFARQYHQPVFDRQIVVGIRIWF